MCRASFIIGGGARALPPPTFGETERTRGGAPQPERFPRARAAARSCYDRLAHARLPHPAAPQGGEEDFASSSRRATASICWRAASPAWQAKTSYDNYEIVRRRQRQSVGGSARFFSRIFPIASCTTRAPLIIPRSTISRSRTTEAPWLLFLNNDTEVISSGWLTAMAEHVQRPEVGAVGARLLYPGRDRTTCGRCARRARNGRSTPSTACRRNRPGSAVSCK